MAGPDLIKVTNRFDCKLLVLSLTPPEHIYNFAYSRDSTQLVIARGHMQSDALLIENVK